MESTSTREKILAVMKVCPAFLVLQSNACKAKQWKAKQRQSNAKQSNARQSKVGHVLMCLS